MTNKPKVVKIGCGAGYERDAIEPAKIVAERGDVKYLCCDGLAERTLTLAQVRKTDDPTKGYNPLLERRLRETLPACVKNGIKMICNFGAANPEAATKVTMQIAKELGYIGLKVATITGDDVSHLIGKLDLIDLETGKPLEIKGQLISANAYIGADPIVEALEKGADIVIGGRIGDLSLFLAPLIYEFGWKADDWDKKAAGSVIAHQLECAAHSTGGNLYYPGYVEVPGLDNLGFPCAEVQENGEAVIYKVDGTGGIVTELSMATQLGYEVFDPANYLTPDVVADVRNVQLKQVGKDRVRIWGARGKERPKTLKVLVGVDEGYIAEGDGGWAGWGCYEKAKVMIENVIKPHLKKLEMEKQIDESRIDIIGVNAILGPLAPEPAVEPNEVRVRVAIKTRSLDVAEQMLDFIERAFPFSAAGGSHGIRRPPRKLLAFHPTLVPRELVPLKVTISEVK